MIYDQGTLVIVPFPFTDLSSAKKRPALVVSPDWFNHTYEDVILAAVTSSAPTPEGELETRLAQDDLSSGTIPRESVIKITKLFTCHRDVVIKQVAHLGSEKLSEVLERLRQFFR